MQFSFGKRRMRSKMSRRWSAWEGGLQGSELTKQVWPWASASSWRDGVLLRSWGCSWCGDLTSQVSSSEGTQQGWALFRVTVTCVSPFKARLIYFCSMCMGVLPSYVSVYHVCELPVRPEEAVVFSRTKLRQLWDAIRLLESEPESSARAGSVLDC